MRKKIYPSIIRGVEDGRKMFALLIDPDKHHSNSIESVVRVADSVGVDLIFVGGSLLQSSMRNCLFEIKKHTSIPVAIFPGSHLQIDEQADAILYLSLISGRNPDFLIGQHVLSSSALKSSGLEVIPTAYILIDGGRLTSVQYISNTQPIPADKPDIVLATALAGEMLGLKLIYLEAGSGAINHVPEVVIGQLKAQIEIPIIVGGGIRTPEQVSTICRAGADLIVVGTAVEQDLFQLKTMVDACHSFNVQTK